MRVKKPKGRYKPEDGGSAYGLSTHALVERYKLLKMQSSTIQRNIDRLKQEQSAIGKEIGEVSNLLKVRRGYEVSDHAVVRYLERIKGFDMDSMRQRVSEYARENPDKCIVSDDGLLITVLEDKPRS